MVLRRTMHKPTSAFIADHLRQPIMLSVGGGPGVPVNGGNGSGSVNIDLPETGVTPGTYGDATNVGQFTVDAEGRISLAADVPIAIAFTDLTDVPSSYIGQAGLIPAVNATEDGLEFVPNGGGGGSLEVLDEGVQITPAATSLDFVGAGVTATAVGDAVTVTIPGGGSGGSGSPLGFRQWTGTVVGVGGNNYIMTQVMADHDMTFDTIYFASVASPTASYQPFVYSDLSDDPDTLLASGNQIIGVNVGVNVAPLTTSVSVLKYEYIWIGINLITAGISIRRNTGSRSAFAGNGGSSVPAASAPAISNASDYQFWAD